MLSAILVTLVILAALGFALNSRRPGGLILRHPYNNRYNDAAASREDHLG